MFDWPTDERHDPSVSLADQIDSKLNTGQDSLAGETKRDIVNWSVKQTGSPWRLIAGQ